VDSVLSSQVRAARGLLGWNRDQLVAASGVTKSTLVRFEDGSSTPRERTIDAIRTSLEHAGVEFIPQNGGGPGVRLRHPLKPTSTMA
jgi:transcriptional regulator with XRE-family HTH domain